MKNSLGEKIKQARLAKGMTLQQVGEEVGLSAGYLSQLERGKSSIAINRLEDIANCLECDIGYLIEKEFQNDSPVMKSYENEVLYIESELSVQYKITSKMDDKTMCPKIDVLMPGFETEDFHHHGGEEFIYVLEGILTFEMDGKSYDLFPGDTAHYHAQKVHSWKNRTNRLVKVLMVSLPNPFEKNKQ